MTFFVPGIAVSVYQYVLKLRHINTDTVVVFLKTYMIDSNNLFSLYIATLCCYCCFVFVFSGCMSTMVTHVSVTVHHTCSGFVNNNYHNKVMSQTGVSNLPSNWLTEPKCNETNLTK